MWDEIEAEFNYPVPLGKADCVITREVTEQPFPFQAVFCVSILDHLNQVDESTMPSLVRSALKEVLLKSRTMGFGVVACSLLRGGWRVSASRAFDAMVSVVEGFRDYDGQLVIYSAIQKHHDYLMGLAQSYGLLR